MKKIMFNDKFLLTQAVLGGTKTMTRRIAKFEPSARLYDEVYNIEGGMNDKGQWIFTLFNKYGEIIGDIIPRYKVGEVVAIAQCYLDIKKPQFDKFGHDVAGNTNKMFVRADLMPHHIKITDVRVERLQDITEDECIKEGIMDIIPADDECMCEGYGYCTSDGGYFLFGTPRDAYASLINKICGKGTLERNPWVEAYTFEEVD